MCRVARHVPGSVTSRVCHVSGRGPQKSVHGGQAGELGGVERGGTGARAQSIFLNITSIIV